MVNKINVYVEGQFCTVKTRFFKKISGHTVNSNNMFYSSETSVFSPLQAVLSSLYEINIIRYYLNFSVILTEKAKLFGLFNKYSS